MDKSYWDLGSIKNPIYRNLEGGHSNGEQHRKYCSNRKRRTGLIQGALDLQDTQAQLTWKRLRSLRVAPVGRQRVSLRVSATGSGRSSSRVLSNQMDRGSPFGQVRFYLTTTKSTHRYGTATVRTLCF
jgi:hypothetical protein